MCGIVGRINSTEQITEEILRCMIDAVAHRGPDGEGTYINENVGIAHKRLSIIDPKNGHQPMCNEDGTVWVTFNGAVYNYLEIRQELVQRGHDVKTYSDTEVIIHAYEEYGEKCVEKFNGMFAFVIYDKNKNKIFGARDRFGIKPFYYYSDEDKFIFASEIKAIIANKEVKREVNIEGIQDYIVFQFTLGKKTLFKNIFKLEPGNYFTIDLNKSVKPKIVQYWDLEFNYDTYHTEDYFVDKLKFLIDDSIRLRLRSDVELGTYLSGGLDSSTTTIIASDCLGNNGLKTFTGKFAEGREYDESYYAKVVAEHANAQYHEITMNAKQFKDNIEDIIYYLDEPGAGPGVFPQYMVSKLASEHVKVVLGGQGGDEIFIGYARYLVAYLEECLKGAIFETADKDKYAVTLESIAPNLSLLKTYSPMIQNFMKDGMFEPQSKRYYRILDRSNGMSNLFNLDVLESSKYSPYDEFEGIFNREDIKSYVNRMTYFDLKASLPALLQVDDRTAMAWGLESRLPFLDYRIAELFASIPPNMKFKGGKSKAIFKKAIKNVLPEEVLNRKDKMGFPVPLVEWYNGELKEYVEEILLGEKTRQRGIYNVEEIEKLLEKETKFSRITWGLLCLELWFRKFMD